MDDIRMTRNVLASILGLMMTLPLVACDRKSSMDLDATSLADQGQLSSRNMNLNPLNKTVCDPWSGGQPQTSENGVRARLAHRGVGQAAWTKSSEYIDQGVMSSRTLFFSDLFVPTRLFDQGFSTQTSAVVQNDRGEKLIEYFGLDFQSQIRLGADDPAGDYEFAVLSDDGATMKIAGADGLLSETLIDNEGMHPTRMGCGLRPVKLEAGKGLDFGISYFQGPRMHIAMTLMWRRAAETPEPLCGASGNHAFFNPDDESKPQKNYDDLLARGWKPVPAANLFLPGQAVFNPCVTGEDLVVEGLELIEASSFQVELQWRTSRPATSQVLVRRLSTGEEYLTDSDQMLRTAHRLVVDGLQAGENYELQAVSVAEDGAKSFSEKVRIATP